MKTYPLQHYLEESVSLYPEKTAVTSGEQSITYRELWEKSGRLANQLKALGLRPGATVGIYLPKSIEAVIAMFAVLRAEAGYIPLDISYLPPARIKLILGASGTTYLISARTQWTALASVPSPDQRNLARNLRVILTDNLLAGEIQTDPLPAQSGPGEAAGVFTCDHTLPRTVTATNPPTPDDLAYVLYTSGSTGIPKGVMITHRNAGTFIDWALGCFRPRPEDIFANVAPLHFDLSVFDVYVSLACGGCLKLVPRQVCINPRALLAWIKQNRISFFYSVPSVWLSLMNHTVLAQGELPALSHILFAGEIFPPRELKRLMNLVPEAAFYNLYGPTETNVCTWHRIKDRAEIGDEPVPIGRACTGSEILVLKEDDTEASVNQEGELLVKGPGVSPGYYKNAEATSAAFRKSPLARHREALFYKTGDIVRVVEPGTFGFVGRRDLMVKCSGFRVELEEVEQALLKHNLIQEAVAIPVYADDKVLALSISAFITVKQGSHFKVIELKEFLAGILPGYMIPERIEVVNEIPRNANGKADRRSLTAQVNNQVNKAAVR